MTKFLNDEWMKKNGYTDEKMLQKEEEEKDQWGGSTIRVGHIAYFICSKVTKLFNVRTWD
jgi:hypothetical protein